MCISCHFHVSQEKSSDFFHPFQNVNITLTVIESSLQTDGGWTRPADQSLQTPSGNLTLLHSSTELQDGGPSLLRLEAVWRTGP